MTSDGIAQAEASAKRAEAPAQRIWSTLRRSSPNLSTTVDMGDSQQPKPAFPLLEVPDLELEPALPARRAPAPVKTPNAAAPPSREYSAPNLFDDDAFVGSNLSIDLGYSEQGPRVLDFGDSGGALADLDLTGNDPSSLALEHDALPHSGTRAAATQVVESSVPWPDGRAPEPARLVFDPLELSLLAGYGQPPKSAYQTPAYAYRVFTRQRELKRLLAPLEAERARAEHEREAALVQLARAVRPEAERVEQFRRLLAPLVELERVANQRGQALSHVNAELSAQASALDAELRQIGEQIEGERARERDTQRLYDERAATAKRAQAKLQRVHIEMRAVTQIAEQKLGPRGGEIPEPEASQLTALRQRAAAVEPEVAQTKVELEQARSALDQASARVNAAGQQERLIARKKQALAQHYQTEIDLRGRGLNESEQQQHAALIELARAVLAGRAAVAVPEPWLEGVRSASERADALLTKCELHLRALDAFDRPKVTQGVRLACTLVALALLLFVLKIAL